MNVIEYEVKSLTLDFDKVVRKQIARLKKAKQQKLQTRMEILHTYGLRSRERISKFEFMSGANYKFNYHDVAIDEEITSSIKNFEADQKRLKAIMVNFEEKKPDMSALERQERADLI